LTCLRGHHSAGTGRAVRAELDIRPDPSRRLRRAGGRGHGHGPRSAQPPPLSLGQHVLARAVLGVQAVHIAVGEAVDALEEEDGGSQGLSQAQPECRSSETSQILRAGRVAHEAARKGFDVLFTDVHKMLTHLHAGRADDSVERRLATHLKPDLLVIADFGLRPLPRTQGSTDVYDIIAERYERRIILLTRDRAPRESPEFFDHALLAKSALERLADRAHIVSITGTIHHLALTADGLDVSLNDLLPSQPNPISEALIRSP